MIAGLGFLSLVAVAVCVLNLALVTGRERDAPRRAGGTRLLRGFVHFLIGFSDGLIVKEAGFGPVAILVTSAAGFTPAAIAALAAAEDSGGCFMPCRSGLTTIWCS